MIFYRVPARTVAVPIPPTEPRRPSRLAQTLAEVAGTISLALLLIALVVVR